MTHPQRWTLFLVALALFLVWSNTFLAFEVLLAPRAGAAPLDWWGLLVVRNVPVAAICAAWCFGARARESVAIVRAHPWRLAACGLLVVPAYNAAMYHGMQERVAGPIASLLTSLAPLYLAALGVAFLGERMTWRKAVGLALGLAGVVLVATAKEPGAAHARHVAEIALAPMAFSVYSILTKPVLRERSALLWTYLVLVAGTVLTLPGLLVLGVPDLGRLDGKAVLLLAYLVVAATVVANAVWSWLLRHLPASTAGLTIFLNPPLTLASKELLAVLLPASFTVAVSGREWLGGAVMLAGVALAVLRPRSR